MVYFCSAVLIAKYAAVSPVLDERSRRRWAAAESLSIGYGGDALVSSATGLARETIRKGRREISQGETPTDRVRRPGAGRPRLEQSQPGLLAALEALVDPSELPSFSTQTLVGSGSLPAG